MKYKVILFTIAIAIIGFSFNNVTQETSYFIQFKISTISTSDQAMVVDQKMKSKSGIKISRTDYITSTYFCVLNPGVIYSEDNFINWFSKLGYEISCFNAGIQSQDKSISPYVLKNCIEDEE
jgi:hypothetical protein